MKIATVDDYFDTLRTLAFSDIFDQIVAHAAGSPINVVNPAVFESASLRRA